MLKTLMQMPLLMTELLPDAPRKSDVDAEAPTFEFPAMKGDALDTADWRGRPVLVVNTASKCGFAGQLGEMQDLHDRFADRGLVILAVPSDDFAQEYNDADRIVEVCETTYGLTLPMTEVLKVCGRDAHPFFAWAKEATGFTPSWNFNKVLLDGNGHIVGTWGAMTRPASDKIVQAIEPLLSE